MGRKCLPRVVWKQAIYSTSSCLNTRFLDRVWRMLKKGSKGTGLRPIYAMYRRGSGGITIYLSATKVNTVALKIKTYIHELLHHLTYYLPTVVENLVDDLIDLLL